MTTDAPANEPKPTFSEALASLGSTLEHLGHTLAGQGAFGWMYRGRIDDARRALERLPAGALQQVSVAAAALSTLADEIAAGRPVE